MNMALLREAPKPWSRAAVARIGARERSQLAIPQEK
jgi:hypothetical protein